MLEHTRQLDEQYIDRKSTAKGSEKSTTTYSNPNLSRWLQLSEMQDQLKEKITEQQVYMYYVPYSGFFSRTIINVHCEKLKQQLTGLVTGAYK